MARNGTHHAKRFTQEWRAFGDEGFSIIALETLPGDPGVIEKREAELRWLKHYDEKGLLLNSAVSSFQFVPGATEKGHAAARLRLKGSRQSPESNLKRSIAQLGIPKNHGAKISATKRAKREQAMI